MKPVALHTSRLILRYAEKGDDDVLFSNYFSNALSSKYLARKPHHNIAQTQLFLTHWCQMSWEIESNQFAWIISLSKTREALGIFLVEIDEHKAQIHYGISPSFEGQGLITEAGKAIVTWLAAQEQLQRIWTVCDIEHQASRRVLEKLGFQKEGILHKWLKLPSFNDQARDCYCYALMTKKMLSEDLAIFNV